MRKRLIWIVKLDNVSFSCKSLDFFYGVSLKIYFLHLYCTTDQAVRRISDFSQDSWVESCLAFSHLLFNCYIYFEVRNNRRGVVRDGLAGDVHLNASTLRGSKTLRTPGISRGFFAFILLPRYLHFFLPLSSSHNQHPSPGEHHGDAPGSALQ